ncbi:hypothetical protein CRENBAI_012057, partial [Crenichthys baileyi]
MNRAEERLSGATKLRKASTTGKTAPVGIVETGSLLGTLWDTVCFCRPQKEKAYDRVFQFGLLASKATLVRRVSLLPVPLGTCVEQFFILLLLIFFLEILSIMLFFIYQDE